ncbi:MAG TPA: hypothetical protein VHH11_16390 [Gammaproteobacteria bacterium]|jgi:hypothetical protein|nr:hypothetical protein [Gammaproteobacteria bacterium]
MTEPRELGIARRQLARAEAGIDSADGLACLAEGLAALDDVLAGDDPAAALTARNLAATYAGRIHERIGSVLAADPQLPEPQLEHYFKVVLAFDQVGAALPASAADLKIAVARALIDRYYEGHPPEAKRRALEQLAAVARD